MDSSVPTALLAAGVGLPVVGFTAAGVAQGSLAASMHAGIGNVAAGSAFAALQTLGAKGAATKCAVALGLLQLCRAKL